MQASPSLTNEEVSDQWKVQQTTLSRDLLILATTALSTRTETQIPHFCQSPCIPNMSRTACQQC